MDITSVIDCSRRADLPEPDTAVRCFLEHLELCSSHGILLLLCANPKIPKTLLDSSVPVLHMPIRFGPQVSSCYLSNLSATGGGFETAGDWPYAGRPEQVGSLVDGGMERMNARMQASIGWNAGRAVAQGVVFVPLATMRSTSPSVCMSEATLEFSAWNAARPGRWAGDDWLTRVSSYGPGMATFAVCTRRPLQFSPEHRSPPVASHSLTVVDSLSLTLIQSVALPPATLVLVLLVAAGLPLYCGTVEEPRETERETERESSLPAPQHLHLHSTFNFLSLACHTVPARNATQRNAKQSSPKQTSPAPLPKATRHSLFTPKIFGPWPPAFP
ncbi:hypothetical protein PG997_004865 [Apiospora hydei]|uniref:Uncharacterized protein n=1 Tax=Apiospora hydei TaxID=1337664 RepID=A0ABR1X3B0_9PEZI